MESTIKTNLVKLKNKIKPKTKLKIFKEVYTVKQHIVWQQHRAGYPYDKWVLADKKGLEKYRLFIDTQDIAIGFAVIFKYPFKEPIPNKLHFEGKDYKMVWSEFCTVLQVEGKPVYKKGEAEIWWDCVCLTNKRKGLSLGRSWETWEREDLKTQVLKVKDIDFVN